MKEKLLVITGSRADYGILLYPIRKVIEQKRFHVSLAVTGTHLSKKHGYTIDQIIADNLCISARVDLGIDGDSPNEVSHYIARGVEGFSEVFQQSRPDLLLVLGDRYEIFAAVSAAMIHNIPVAHIHGGELTLGLIDDPIRHSITKMSHIHFTSTETYAKRVIQMGEKPDKVFNVGAPGLDLIKRIERMSKKELETKLGASLGSKNILVTYHPVTLDKDQTQTEINDFFKALVELPSEYKIWIGMPNADTYSDVIRDSIHRFLKTRPDTSTFESLGSKGYISMMEYCDVVVGNSSSGIIEAPYLGKAVIDIGLRQSGRLADLNVIRCEGSFSSIQAALMKSISLEFQSQLLKSVMYGEGNSSEKISQILNGISFNNILLKGFYDLK